MDRSQNFPTAIPFPNLGQVLYICFPGPDLSGGCPDDVREVHSSCTCPGQGPKRRTLPPFPPFCATPRCSRIRNERASPPPVPLVRTLSRTSTRAVNFAYIVRTSPGQVGVRKTNVQNLTQIRKGVFWTVPKIFPQPYPFLIWDKFCTFVFRAPTCPGDVRPMYASSTARVLVRDKVRNGGPCRLSVPRPPRCSRIRNERASPPPVPLVRTLSRTSTRGGGLRVHRPDILRTGRGPENKCTKLDPN